MTAGSPLSAERPRQPRDSVVCLLKCAAQGKVVTTAKDWAEIPGNKHAFERLRALVASGESIAFVGAGASASLYPLWNGLLKIFADEAVKRGLAAPADRDLWLSPGTKPQQAVRGIKQALGDGIYAELLRRIFGPRTGADGNYFTPVHAALMRLRFRGYVTTNYDLALEQARMRIRTDSVATGFATWKDDGEVWRWIRGEVFREQPCPILFAHGVYQRADTVVLGAQEYREAYRPGSYRRLFDKLWGEESLVFVGFGFSDPWLDFLADEVITQTAARVAAAPQHVAIVGLREDEESTPERRRLFQDQYNAEPLFYPVKRIAGGGEDHGALLGILDELAQASGVIAAAPAAGTAAPPMPSPAPAHAPPRCWVHETTEDDRYVERAGVLERLDRWADDPEVRLIAVTGLGGLGKTSLIGHWLKRRGGAGRRPNAGLFYWSFYADRDVRAFVARLLAFATDDLKMSIAGGSEPAQNALAILETAAVLLVLDGLEVLQERPGAVGYGEFLDDDLRVLLDGAARLRRQSLVVLTSRFPFADLTPYLGRGLRALDLDQLAPAEGAALLAACSVSGTAVEREDVSRRFEGHPLALRVFAATLASKGGGDPTRLVEHVFADPELDENDPLERKLKHLLASYEAGLPRHRIALLGLVSLFRTPAPEPTLLTLARGLPAVQSVLEPFADEDLRHELRAMANEHLLVHDRQSGVYSCHPVLRDHFRGTLLGWGSEVASGAAGLLAGQPSGDQAKDIGELEPVLTAIEILLEAGDFPAADELYRGRLNNGRVFLSLPAPAEGLRCALGFVGEQARRDCCEKMLSTRSLSFYLNEGGLSGTYAGELELARQCLEQSSEIDRHLQDGLNLSSDLQNQSDLCLSLGELTVAEARSREALSLARGFEKEPSRVTRNTLASLGGVLGHQGRVRDGLVAFEEANEIEKSRNPDGNELHSFRGVEWADLLLRLERIGRAIALTEANLRICTRNWWQDDLARCHWILGRADTKQSRFEPAAQHLTDAEAIFRRGHQIADLPKVLLARADLDRRRRRWTDAWSAVEEALRLAAPRHMRLVHADALVLRARIRLDRARSEHAPAEILKEAAQRAQDDSEAGLRLARNSGYAWAERDAFALLAETWQILGNPEKAVQVRRDADALSARLADPGSP